MQWTPEDLSAQQRLEKLADEASNRFPDIELNQDVSWLESVGRHRGITPFVLCAREGGRLVGLAPFETEDATLKLALGDFVLWRQRVRRFAIESGPLVDTSPAEPVIEECFATLADRLPENGVVFLRGVALGSPLDRLLRRGRNALRSKFNVVPHGPVYLRCRIHWSGSLDDYLGSLGKVSRKDLRRTLRKAPEVLGAEPELVAFTEPSQVRQFVTDASAVSRKTYQAELGIGMKCSDASIASLTAAARDGHLLGHVLYRNNEPVAYHLGFVHGHRFYMVDGGYDPAWAKAQVGMFTFLKALQDIEARRIPVRLLDYLYGDSQYKLRTSNERTPERHYYLTRRAIDGTLLAGGLMAADGLSRGVGSLLAKCGLKDRVKALVGRQSIKRRLESVTAFFATAGDGAFPLLALA